MWRGSRFRGIQVPVGSRLYQIPAISHQITDWHRGVRLSALVALQKGNSWLKEHAIRHMATHDADVRNRGVAYALLAS